MTTEIAFVLINPYTIRKSRTGGIIGRYLARSDLRLVGARMFGPSQELCDEYAQYLESSNTEDPAMAKLLADYVRRDYAPDATTGRTHRAIMLLFEGSNAIEKITKITGSSRILWGSGKTVRDTYGDFVQDSDGAVRYFEPAVLIGPTGEVTRETLRIWAKYIASDAGFVQGALDMPDGDNNEQTLVLLKPDNFRIPSIRAGNIIDVLSISGLRMVCMKRFSMSVEQAERFYGPVKETLERIFPEFGAARAAQALSREFGFPIGEEAVLPLCRELAPKFSMREFENIVEFMSGSRPSNCDISAKGKPGSSACLAVVYEGPDAVRTIREILGATDPTKARPGSIRREFGTNILINAAHASDSVENARREMGIIEVESAEPFLSIVKSALKV